MNVATSNVIARRIGDRFAIYAEVENVFLVSTKIRDFYTKYRNKINKQNYERIIEFACSQPKLQLKK